MLQQWGNFVEFRANDTFVLDSKTVGENMRWVRTRVYNLSQTEAARRLNISRSTLHRLEEGQSLPPLDLLHRFARLAEGYYFQPVMFFVRRLAPFEPRDIALVAQYFDAIYQTCDEFLVAWHIKMAAELQLVALELNSAGEVPNFFRKFVAPDKT